MPYTTQTIKGVEYAVFSAEPGTYEAAYTSDTTAPVDLQRVGGRRDERHRDRPVGDRRALDVGRAVRDRPRQPHADRLLAAPPDRAQRRPHGAHRQHHLLLPGDLGGRGRELGELGRVELRRRPSTRAPPTVNLVAPNGGERLYTGSPYTIRWTATDDVGVTAIDVAVSVDGGTSFAAVAGCTGLPGRRRAAPGRLRGRRRPRGGSASRRATPPGRPARPRPAPTSP